MVDKKNMLAIILLVSGLIIGAGIGYFTIPKEAGKTMIPYIR